jgi:hypothetical protein
VPDTDRIAVGDCCAEEDTLKAGVALEETVEVDVGETDRVAVADSCAEEDTLKAGVAVEESIEVDVGETDRIAVSDCCAEDDTLNAGVALEDSLGLADEDNTDAGEGVPVWQGVFAGDSDSELVIDAKGVGEGVAV